MYLNRSFALRRSMGSLVPLRGCRSWFGALRGKTGRLERAPGQPVGSTMYRPGGRRRANPGGPGAWLRGLAAACLAAAVLTGTLAFTFAPGRSFSPGQGGQPGPPTKLEAAPDGSSEVTLSWDPPASDGGAGIIFYDVSEGTTFIQKLPASDTSYTVAVASGTSYTFLVSATNDFENQGPAATVTYPPSQTTPPPNSQTITFGPLAGQPVNAQFFVSARATSGLNVGFSSATPGVCTVSDSTVFDQAEVSTLTAGVCSIVAAQDGNARYAVAADVTRSVQIGSATAASGLPLVIIVAVAVAVILAAAAGAALAVRRRQLRSRSWPAPELGVRAVPHAGPPVVAHVQVTGTRATHSLRIEPHAGAGVTTIEKTRP
jgi:hypothetical protein